MLRAAEPWLPPADVSFARGVALGLAIASLFWGGFILTVWGG
jgi:hypothetical protein